MVALHVGVMQYTDIDSNCDIKKENIDVVLKCTHDNIV